MHLIGGDSPAGRGADPNKTEGPIPPREPALFVSSLRNPPTQAVNPFEHKSRPI